MIHYHGGPITPLTVAQAVWKGRHAFVSFAWPGQAALAFELCQSVALDNGAFTIWKQGGTMDVAGYVAWVNEWKRHPGFDWALIPDVIDGTEADNDMMFGKYRDAGGELLSSVPVWHLHESIGRLERLCHGFPRVAFGSSGAYADPGSPEWWQRMGEAMDAICDEDGRPPCKLHGLRMLNPTIFSQLPFASADSTNVAQNHARQRRMYRLSPGMAALVLLDRIEHHASAPRWNRTFGTQMNMDLVG